MSILHDRLLSMGFWTGWLRGQPEPLTTFVEAAGSGSKSLASPQFATSIDNGVLYGVPPGAPINQRRISREEALTCSAVKSARDLIANALGGLEMNLHAADGTIVDWPFLDQPEEGVVGSITWTDVAEDLLFDARAWLAITHVNVWGLPAHVARLDPTTVTAQPDLVVHYGQTGNGVATRWSSDKMLIRIDSPNAPLLVAGARAIRTLIALGETTDNVANALPPLTYFRTADGENADPDEEEVIEVLDAWEEARKTRATAFVPLSLKLEALGWDPKQLELPALRDQAVLDIARHARVDPEELGVSTTSRTYFNAFDRKQNFIEFTLKGYLKAISGRLSMDDVTPRGHKVRHDLDEFFKADTLTRYQGYEVGRRVGALTDDDIRISEGKPLLTPEEQAAARAIAAPAAANTPARKEIAS